jgi:hypothetical protein
MITRRDVIYHVCCNSFIIIHSSIVIIQVTQHGYNEFISETICGFVYKLIIFKAQSN